MKLDWKSCVRLGVTVFVTFLAIHYWSHLTGFVSLLFGAASALNVALKTILNPGEEVVIFTPYFLEYNFYINYDLASVNHIKKT